SATQRVRTGVRGVLLPSSRGVQVFDPRDSLVVLRGRETFAEFPETYRVSVRLLAPYERQTVTVRVTLSGGGEYALERDVTFGAVASKTLHFDFDADEVTAPNRVAVNVLGGKRATFSVNVPRSRDPID
ncbi:MAG: hypothetical protein AAFY15_04735, partial [Cyanobacteria bacterium J06648_11]